MIEGGKRPIRLFIRPRKGEIGEAVPFLLEWFWKCKDGDDFHDKISMYVSVKGRDDTRPTGNPVIFQGGTLIQADKYIAGDDVTGGQKGDKVEINRGSGVKSTIGKDAVEVQTGRKPTENLCPTCHLPVEAEAEFCSACGNALPPRSTGKQ